MTENKNIHRTFRATRPLTHGLTIRRNKSNECGLYTCLSAIVDFMGFNLSSKNHCRYILKDTRTRVEVHTYDTVEALWF